MSKYILHGGYTSKRNHLNNSFFKEITKALEGEIKILLIYFAGIYIRGGNVFKLLEVLKSYPKFLEVVEEKVIVGSSAGAYVLSKYFYSQEGRGIFDGLGILPIAITCHYKGNQEVLELLKEKAEDLEIVLLNDFEHKVIIVQNG